MLYIKRLFLLLLPIFQIIHSSLDEFIEKESKIMQERMDNPLWDRRAKAILLISKILQEIFASSFSSVPVHYLKFIWKNPSEKIQKGNVAIFTTKEKIHSFYATLKSIDDVFLYPDPNKAKGFLKALSKEVITKEIEYQTINAQKERLNLINHRNKILLAKSILQKLRSDQPITKEDGFSTLSAGASLQADKAAYNLFENKTKNLKSLLSLFGELISLPFIKDKVYGFYAKL